MTISCDVAILGGGTGGYVAAIRAAQLGKSVVVIEMDKLGGTCLHRGCIPSKSLLRSAEVYAEINESESYGIETSGVQLVFPKVQKRKEAVVEQLHQGVQYLMRKNKIQVVKGKGRVTGPSIFSAQRCCSCGTGRWGDGNSSFQPSYYRYGLTSTSIAWSRTRRESDS